MSRPLRLLALLLAPAIALSACSGDGDGTSAGGTQSANTGVEEVEAAWSQLALPASAQPRDDLHAFADSVPATGSLPLLRAGSTGKPGKPRHAAVWTADAKGIGRPLRLDVAGPESNATSLASDGKLTAVSGSTWDSGEFTPFVLTSDDRKQWNAVELPEEVLERSIFMNELVIADGRVLALGVDGDDRPAAVDLDEGAVIDLPAPKGEGEPSAFVGAAARGTTVVALASTAFQDGTPGMLAYRSTDGGATWQRANRPGGQRPVAAGIVAADDGFVATGSAGVDNDEAGAAWFTADGRAWKREQIASYPGHNSGWSNNLSAPTLHGGSAVAGYSDGEKLTGQVLRRSAGGAWTPLATTTEWVSPNASTVVESNAGRDLQVLREWNGDMQLLRLSDNGRIDQLTAPRSSKQPIEWWESLGLTGEGPVLVGGHTDVEVRGGGSWTMGPTLERFSAKGKRLTSSRWEPRAAAGTSSVYSVTATNGDTVVLGDRPFSSDDPSVTDESGLVGWFRKAGSKKWVQATGLTGPRTEFTYGVEAHGKWWVTVGIDRRSFTGSDPFYGAVWTSRDGRRWTREQGAFELSESTDTWFTDSCRLPSGDLLVVGGAENPQAGSVPFAFRRSGNDWRKVDTSVLGAGARALTACASVGDVTLLQGAEGNNQRLWSTEDGERFTPVEVGHEDDNLGEIQSLENGFAAPGYLDEGRSGQPVVWLSRDGARWYPVQVPSDRLVTPSGVLAWGDRLLVASTGSSGPDVHVLGNPAELLAAASDGGGEE